MNSYYLYKIETATRNVRICMSMKVRLGLQMCGRDSECTTGGFPEAGEPEGVPDQENPNERATDPHLI